VNDSLRPIATSVFAAGRFGANCLTAIAAAPPPNSPPANARVTVAKRMRL